MTAPSTGAVSTVTTLPAHAPTTTTVAPPTTPTTAASPHRLARCSPRCIAPQVEPGKFGEATYTVPDGTVLRITDFVVQNPNDDRGLATVAIGDQAPLLSWSLEFVAPIDRQPFVSPIEVQPGTVVHFVVTCTQVGSTTATSGTCQPTLALSGRTSPV